MARKNRSNRPRSRTRRDTITPSRVSLTHRVLPRPLFVSRPRTKIPVPSPRKRSPMRFQADRRRYHPYRPGRPYAAKSGKMVFPKMQITDDLRVSRRLPDDALVCLRRNARREVLFAKGRSGRNRPARRKSDVRCK